MMAKKRAAAEAAPPIIVVKKIAHKGGHHGGAWKVAYADFVTTMMALFIVLWAAGQDTNVRESIATYFRNPSTPVRIAPTGGRGTSVLPASTGVVAQAEATPRDGTVSDENETVAAPPGPSVSPSRTSGSSGHSASRRAST